MVGSSPSVANVGAGLSKAQSQATVQRAMTEHRPAAKDLGTAALKLISSAMTAQGSAQGHDLDIMA